MENDERRRLGLRQRWVGGKRRISHRYYTVVADRDHRQVGYGVDAEAGLKRRIVLRLAICLTVTLAGVRSVLLARLVARLRFARMLAVGRACVYERRPLARQVENGNGDCH